MKLLNKIKSRMSMKQTSVLHKNIKVWVDCYGEEWIAKSKISTRKKSSYITDKKYPWVNKPTDLDPKNITIYLIDILKSTLDSRGKYIGCNVKYSKWRVKDIVELLYEVTKDNYWKDVMIEADIDENYNQFIQWSYLHDSLKNDLKELESSRRHYSKERYTKMESDIKQRIKNAKDMFKIYKWDWQKEIED